MRPPIQVTVVWPECQSGQEGGADNTKVLKKNKFSQVVLSGAGQVTVWPKKMPNWRGQEERPENTFKNSQVLPGL